MLKVNLMTKLLKQLKFRSQKLSHIRDGSKCSELLVISIDTCIYRCWINLILLIDLCSGFSYLYLSTLNKSQLSRYNFTDVCYILVYFTHIVLKFFFEKQIVDPETQAHLFETRLVRIVAIYLKTDFIYDLVTWFPWYQICYHFKYA